MGGHVARTRGEERRIQGFGGETLGKEQLERSRNRWKRNIKNISAKNRIVGREMD
jgi:hypothetical protein